MTKRIRREKTEETKGVMAKHQPRTTLEGCWEYTKERMIGLKPQTIEHHSEIIKHLFRYIPGDTPIDKYFETQLIKFLEKKSQTVKPGTYNTILQTIRQVLDAAVELGAIKKNPARGLRKIKNPPNPVRPFRDDQLHALLAQPNCDTLAGWRDWVLMNLMLDNGIRLSEALNLTKEQIDLKNRSLRGVVGKNGRSEDLPISREMMKILREYLPYTGDDEEYVFPSDRSGRVNRRTIEYRFKNYGESAGITGVRVSPHTFRHTFAKMYLQSGGDAFSLRQVLRHSTMDQVSEYVNLWGTDLQKIHDKHSPVVKFTEQQRVAARKAAIKERKLNRSAS